MECNLLIAAYENKRFSFLTAYLLHRPPWIDPARAFAYYRRVSPIFHRDVDVDDYGHEDWFETIYPVKADFIWKVLIHTNKLVAEGREQELLFPSVRRHFAGTDGLETVRLVHALRYCQLSGHLQVRAAQLLTEDKETLNWTSELGSPFEPEEVALLD